MKRHLLYSIYPRKDNPEWILNILELKLYAQVFDECVFLLREDDTTVDDIDFIYKVLEPFGDDFSCFSIKNDKTLGETHGFIGALGEILHHNPNDITFYAHTKGVTHKPGPRLDAIRQWRQQMYAANLHNMMRTELALSTYVSTGAFRMIGGWPQFPNSSWCYAGNFWWVNNAKLLEKNWDTIGNDNYAVEGYLGRIIPYEESHCSYEDNCKRDLYKAEPPKRTLYKCKRCKWNSYKLIKCMYCYATMEVVT